MYNYLNFQFLENPHIKLFVCCFPAALPGSDSELDVDATQDDSGLVGNSQNEQGQTT